MTTARAPLAALSAVRVLFGALVLLRTTPALVPFDLPLLRSSRPILGWPTADWHVAAYGVSLAPFVVAALCIVRTLATMAFTLGVAAPQAGVAGALIGWVVLSQDALGYINTYHLLFLGMLVLAVSASASSLALRPELAVDPSSALALVRAFVASVYAWSGVSKLNASWLSGAALGQHVQSGRVAGALADALLASPSSRVATAAGIAAVEIALGPLLLLGRTRRAALAAALVFHLALQWTVRPDVFGLAMGILLISFVDCSGPDGSTGRGRPASAHRGTTADSSFRSCAAQPTRFPRTLTAKVAIPLG